jgi:hypothetical protein
VGGNTRDGSTPFSRIESTCKSQLNRRRSIADRFGSNCAYLGETAGVPGTATIRLPGDPWRKSAGNELETRLASVRVRFKESDAVARSLHLTVEATLDLATAYRR